MEWKYGDMNGDGEYGNVKGFREAYISLLEERMA
jgi:hypothetical protein